MSKKKAYVIGTNVSKSLSPTIFNYWLRKYRIEAEYRYKEVKEANFDKEIKIRGTFENINKLSSGKLVFGLVSEAGSGILVRRVGFCQQSGGSQTNRDYLSPGAFSALLA